MINIDIKASIPQKTDEETRAWLRSRWRAEFIPGFGYSLVHLLYGPAEGYLFYSEAEAWAYLDAELAKPIDCTWAYKSLNGVDYNPLL